MYTPPEPDDDDRRGTPSVQPSVLFDEETCDKIDWTSLYPNLNQT